MELKSIAALQLYRPVTRFCMKNMQGKFSTCYTIEEFNLNFPCRLLFNFILDIINYVRVLIFIFKGDYYLLHTLFIRLLQHPGIVLRSNLEIGSFNFYSSFK